jgi:ammonia channel protein AmtB
MNKKLTSWGMHYAYGCFAAVFNGSFATAKVALGAAGASAAGMVDLHGMTVKGFFSVLVGTICYYAIVYFSDHRLPEDLPNIDGGTTPETFKSVMAASQPKTPAIPAVVPPVANPPIQP